MSTKMITAEALIGKFRQALSEHWGYIWGTAGESWTAAKQKELERTTDSDRAQGRQYGSKWIGHTVADCSGLFSWAFRQLGGYMYHGSDTMYRKYCVSKGELKKGKRTDGATLKPGTAVFVWNGSKYSHVGLFVGNGTVIEAMGTINGVTTTKVTAGKWTHWGELVGVDYTSVILRSGAPGERASGSFSAEDGRQPRDQAAGGVEGSPSVHPTLRKGSKGTAVSEMQTMLLKLGYDLGPCGIDGDFGKATDAAVRSFQSDHRLTVDGICGADTWAELEKAVVKLNSASGTSVVIPSEVEGSHAAYCVIISGLDLTQAKALSANYPGSVIEKECD